jgi:hypothetical protein
VQVIARMTTAVAALAMVALAAPAQAKKYVYSPIVEETEKELEYYVDWREAPDGTDIVGHELEFEYGFAPRDMIAFYGVWEAVSGDDPSFQKYKVEWIHQVFEQGERGWDFGTYLEYAIADKGGADKVEFKPLFERGLGPGIVTLNGVFEKEIGENAAEGTEFGYAARYAWRLRPDLVPAVEAYGGFGEMQDVKKWDDQSHVVGPVVDLRLGGLVCWQVGALFGLTDGSEDVRLKSNLALEWY